MSSLRNAAKRRTHKERDQPHARTRLGLLEHHKDYVLRARDYHHKADTIRALREKAFFRNPDEYYFHMGRSEMKDGVHRDINPSSLTHDQTLVTKTRDIAYVTMKAQHEAHRIERLQADNHFLGTAPYNRHVVFVETEEDANTFDPVTHFDTPAELVGRAFNRPRTRTLRETQIAAQPAENPKKRDLAYQELTQRLERKDKLEKALRLMHAQKEVMGKGNKRKVKDAEGTTPAVFRWRKERKR